MPHAISFQFSAFVSFWSSLHLHLVVERGHQYNCFCLNFHQQEQLLLCDLQPFELNQFHMAAQGLSSTYLNQDPVSQLKISINTNFKQWSWLDGEPRSVMEMFPADWKELHSLFFQWGDNQPFIIISVKTHNVTLVKWLQFIVTILKVLHSQFFLHIILTVFPRRW